RLRHTIPNRHWSSYVFSSHLVHAAKLAQKDGIQVYTVVIGTTSGGRIPLHDARGRFEKYLTDRQGNVVHTRLEDTQLREIATAEIGRASSRGAYSSRHETTYN